MGDIADIEGRT